MFKYKQSSLKDLEVTNRKDKLFNIIKFNNNLLNLSILNSCLSNDLARLLACYLAKISLIVLA